MAADTFHLDVLENGAMFPLEGHLDFLCFFLAALAVRVVVCANGTELGVVGEREAGQQDKGTGFHTESSCNEVVIRNQGTTVL